MASDIMIHCAWLAFYVGVNLATGRAIRWVKGKFHGNAA